MTTTDTTARSSSRLVMIAMILSVSMSFIDQTIVAIASPDIQRDLDLTGAQGEWVINAYLIALAATFALGGRVSDVWGRKRMVMIGVAGFAITSALCGATPDNAWAETWLIAARAGQGVFAALLMPAAIAIVYSSAAPERRGRSMAMFFGLTGAFTAVGPIVGSYLLEWTWRAIFWINLPVAVLALIATAAASIAEKRRHEQIDWLGAVIIAAGMALSVVGFAEANTWGWDSVWTWACLIAGALLLAVFVLVERNRPIPLVRLDIFKLRGFRVDSAVLFLAMIAFVPVSYFLSLYASVSLGKDASGTSLLLLQFFIGFLVAAQIGGRIFDARGAKPTIIVGCAVGIAGFGWWATQVTTLTGGAQQWPLIVGGAGIGLLLGPSSADAVSRARDASYGEVTGLNQTVRNYGSSLGFAILGTILAQVFTSRFSDSLVGIGLSRGEADHIAGNATGTASASSFSSVPASIRSEVERAVAEDFAKAMQAVIIAMAVALAIALLVALRHPGDRPATDGMDLPDTPDDVSGKEPIGGMA